ncbi:PAS domain S-box protein [Guyparkeria sp. SCN-R1]|uniref:PAS domain S-box protein n=1 Tax=Guyparkeria sp. SCN-R1 TaxID=2341113 RepID=UPI001315861F|nr:PAS domain S-box protein [Guyparkeria sp. SCN-R1]
MPAERPHNRRERCRSIGRGRPFGRLLRWAALILLTSTPLLTLAAPNERLVLGIFAVRPVPLMELRFGPLVDYLDASVDSVDFEMRVLDLDDLDRAIQRNEIDLLLTTPTHYELVRSENALSGVLGTLVTQHRGRSTRSLGGVIIARRDAEAINELADLTGRVIAAPGERFLGGYQAPLFEALEAGFDLRDTASFRFLGNHDAVVRAVLDREAEVGFIRTGVLQDLIDRGHIGPRALKVINRQHLGDYPYLVSTRLYPEWPLVTMPHVGLALERQIAAALFSLDVDDPAAQTAGIAGFGPPADYLPVERVTRELRLPPFDGMDEITWTDIWAQHRNELVLLATALLMVALLSVALVFRQVALRRSEERFRRFFEDNASVLLLVDFDNGEILDANEAAAGFYGWPREELIGHPVDRLWAHRCQQFDAVCRSGVVGGHCHLHTHRLRSGEERRVEVHVTPMNDHPDGGRMFVIVHDITERERAEKSLERERERLRNVIEGTNVGTWEWNIQTGETVFNQRWAEMVGYELSELEPTTIGTWERFAHPDDLAHSASALQACFHREKDYYEVEVRMRHREGHWIWVLDRGRILEWDADGKPLRMWGTHQDITARKQMEQDLQLAASVFVHAREAILITDLDARIIDVNAAFTEMTGWRRDEVIGHTPKFLQSGKHDGEFYRHMRKRLRSAGYWSGELWNRHKNGELFAERLTISLVHDAEGRPRNYIALASDITDIKKYQSELEHRANHDALTGLPNRVLMADRLRQSMATARRGHGMLALAFLDLDGFKAVNDVHGHDMGDKLLIDVARDLGTQLRETDTLARISGDEFVIILGGLEQASDAEPIIARLVEAAARERHIDGATLQVTASIGYTFYPQANEADDETLLKQADSAMYEAKAGGRNRSCRYQPPT